jgi:alpha-glucosidase (family GH31 glycosyl hydrolase)
MKTLLSGIVAFLTLFTAARAADVHVPVADSSAMVMSGEARFTVLTPRLLRLEWAPGGQFEDHASLVVLNRKLPVPRFRAEREGGVLFLHTDSLVLRYREGSGRFTEQNLQITFGPHTQPGVKTWHPGLADSANLRGTARTLDAAKGAIDLEPGLLSRTGWTVVDDSQRPLLDNGAWPWVMPRPAGERQDWYFFGYGTDYKAVMGDFVKIAGRIPIPPRFAFGAWWSKYWSYTDTEMMDLVNEFRLHSVPLDVLVVDMDWHLTFDMRWSQNIKDQAGQKLGWTGYTWDRNFFPDPDGFMRWCEDHGLKTTLNLHPASGIQPHEEQYPAMARSMGIDPATQKYVPFDIVDRKFADNYLTHVIHPLEDRGVDFWWLDWQQWGTTTIPGVTPTWWLNYVFFTDMERRGKNRPLLFHRWGGLGNHRYQIGFSGDAISVWESLAFQPYFTATAANVGFGFWSHDIGGHMPGIVTPELYTRWIQFGVFSPILRTHTTKNPEAERRIWAYPDSYFTVMRDAYRLRYAMIPYIYTEARKAYDSGVSIVRPMYHDYPLASEAYVSTAQYMFGDAMIVAPVATAGDSTGTAVKQVWLPDGAWYEWFTGAKMQGPGMFTRSYMLEEVPVFVKAGAIVAMQPDMMNTGEKPVDPLILNVYPGKEGAAQVYEDAGNSTAYQNGECTWLPVTMKQDGERGVRVVVGKREGKYAGMLAQRAYEFRLVNRMPPEVVELDGRAVPRVAEGSGPGWWYDGERATVVVRTARVNAGEEVELEVMNPRAVMPVYVHGLPGAVRRLRKGMELINAQWPKEWSSGDLVSAVQTGNRMSRWPEKAPAELEALGKRIDVSLKQLQPLAIPDSVRARVRGLLERSRELLSR